MKKRTLSKLFAFVMTASLVFTSNVMVAFADDDDEPSDDLESRVEHVDKNFEDLELFDINEDEFDDLIFNVEVLCQDQDCGSDTIESLKEVEHYFNLCVANQSLSYIYTTLDASDDEADEVYKLWEEATTNYGDKLMILYNTVANSACSSYLEEYIDDADDWTDIVEYKPMTDEQKAMGKRQTELSLEYDDLSLKVYKADIYGTEYTMEELETAVENGDIDYNQYMQGLADIFTAQNQEKAELFIEIVNLNNEIAQSYGYDNYADYAYEKVYDRDYTHDDLKEFKDQCKEYFSPLLTDSYNAFVSVRDDYLALSEEDMSYEECCRMLSEHFDDISPDLWESFNYMVDHNLCNMEIDDKKAEGGYTANIGGDYKTVFLFNNSDGSVQDLSTLIHEFGHYNQMYFASEKEWEDNLTNLDLAEIHSQGMECLYDAYADELYGEYADTMRIVNTYSAAWACVEGCKEDEFQYRVYTETDPLTVDRINEIYYEVSAEYGDQTLFNTYYLSMYGYIPSGQMFEWADVHHTFQSPFYYISYAISMGAVQELNDLIINDRQAGISTYLKLVDVGSNGDFQETMDLVGLNNPIAHPNFEKYSYNLRVKAGLDVSGYNIGNSGGNNVTTTPTTTTHTDYTTEHARDNAETGIKLTPMMIVLICVAGTAALAMIIIVICLIISSSQKKKDKKVNEAVPVVPVNSGANMALNAGINPFDSIGAANQNPMAQSSESEVKTDEEAKNAELSEVSEEKAEEQDK